MTGAANPFEDVFEAIQKGVFAALASDLRVQEFFGGADPDAIRIYDEVAEPEPVFPYITLGATEVNDDGNTCSEDSVEVFQTVHVWSQNEGGQAFCKRVCGPVRRALNSEIAIAGQITVSGQFESARFMVDPDGITQHGILVFRYLLDPLEA